MGLLDDAIREHMELKRLRGADPSEVARQERDALGPVARADDPDEPGAFEEEEDGGNAYQEAHADLGGHTDTAHEHGIRSEDDLARASHPERGADFANVGQETAELDMRTVLDGPPEDGSEEAQAIPGETPGQERLWFDQQQAPRDSDFDP